MSETRGLLSTERKAMIFVWGSDGLFAFLISVYLLCFLKFFYGVLSAKVDIYDDVL